MLQAGRFLCLFVAAVCLLGQSCQDLSKGEYNYNIDKPSPNGVYRVSIESRAIKVKSSNRYSEQVRVQFFKERQIVHSFVWENSDQYELSFRDTAPVIEWIDNNTLRMGLDRSDQSFYDELILSNNTNEVLSHMEISYGRFESFDVFDLTPKSQITLRASPGFKPDGTSNSYLGYGGLTRSGKKFVGTLKQKERTSRSDGPFRFSITITESDLR